MPGGSGGGAAHQTPAKGRNRAQDGQSSCSTAQKVKIHLIPASVGVESVLCPISHTPTQRVGGAESTSWCDYCLFFFLFSISNVTERRTKCSISGSAASFAGREQAGCSDTGQGQGEMLCLLPTHTSSLLPHPLVPTSQVAWGATFSREAPPTPLPSTSWLFCRKNEHQEERGSIGPNSA